MSNNNSQQQEEENLHDINEESKFRKSQLEDLTDKMFTNLSDYLTSELRLSSQDYELLEKMNLQTANKYKNMADTTSHLITFMDDLKQKYENFQPYLERIDQIEQGIETLENTVLQLDAYSKKLEQQFKLLDQE
eukprot:TRINITY_DN112943_c0_g1_i1.p1 TRINITY_DN112943_c0_g1~~TRINITY_DN112943_c0_g1_i1.p1  ORF type:complete len:134 (+),score=24.47 TRINITY_DN112943_c0_g1_i1:98-499(+)